MSKSPAVAQAHLLLSEVSLCARSLSVLACCLLTEPALCAVCGLSFSLDLDTSRRDRPESLRLILCLVVSLLSSFLYEG